MHRGFYNKDIGYWEVIPPYEEEIINNYPLGTYEIPLKPGANYDWNGTEWIEIEIQEPEPSNIVYSKSNIYKNITDEEYVLLQNSFLAYSIRVQEILKTITEINTKDEVEIIILDELKEILTPSKLIEVLNNSLVRKEY